MLIRSLPAIILLFVVNACSRPTHVLEAIPKTTAFVVAVDPLELISQADKPYMAELVDDLKDNLTTIDTGDFKEIQDLLSNPQQTGIDFTD